MLDIGNFSDREKKEKEQGKGTGKEALKEFFFGVVKTNLRSKISKKSQERKKHYRSPKKKFLQAIQKEMKDQLQRNGNLTDDRFLSNSN